MMLAGVTIGQSAVVNQAAVAEARFSWTEWHLHPDVLLLIFALLGLYLVAWQRYGTERELPRERVALFLSGVLVLYAAAGTPIHELSEQYLFGAHMVQHLMFTMVAAPLLLAGIPGWMWQPLLADRVVFRVAKFLTYPVVAILIFNVTTVFTHLPGFVDYTLTHHSAHFMAHILLVVTAGLMWWPVYSRVPELPRLRAPWQMMYLFAQSMIPAIVASFITFSGTAVYDFYAEAPRLWGTTAVSDQRMAGLIMKLAGTIILWGVITVRFFEWYGDEEEKALGLPNWQEAEEELQRMGLTRK